MKLLYNLSISTFSGLLQLLAPFHKKAKLMSLGRKGWKEKVLDRHLGEKVIWFHCASLGEFEQGRPIIEFIKKEYPDWQIVVTFFSSSGYEIRKDYEFADLILYLPFDTKSNAKQFVNLVNPKIAVFIKYEFWYNYLHELKSKSIPTFLVSGIFRGDQKFFKKGWEFFKEMLDCFTYLFVQNETSKNLIHSIGLENVTISGDTRFDRVKEICSNPRKIEIAEAFSVNETVMVIGSSWPEDMEVLYALINGDLPIKFIIAPHEIGSEKISRLTSRLKCKYQLYSKADIKSIQKSRVIVIDNIGMLSSLYQYGKLAYIGGAFGDGLHNILEAATFGMPIIFGKGKDNYKYQEAIDLVEQGGAFEVENETDVNIIVEDFIQNPDKLKMVSEVASKYVDDNSGATDIFMNHVKAYLN